jgi:alcohol dehydrogenase (NADP+)
MGCDDSKEKHIYATPYFETKAFAMKQAGGKIEEHTI